MDDILKLLYTLERIPFKNKGRMLQAYHTLIGSRKKLGIEFEFNGEISEETAWKFINEVEHHPLMDVIVEHNMGYDGRGWRSDTHKVAEGDSNREYRIQFHVEGQWKWARLLSDILTLFVVYKMDVGSIHVHYNLETFTTPVSTSKGLRNRYTGKTIYTTNYNKLSDAISKQTFKLYGVLKEGTLHRLKQTDHTRSFEIRTITPTVFYSQLMMEILFWEQVVKQLSDKQRRTDKKRRIVEVYHQNSSVIEEQLGSSDLAFGILLKR